MALRDLLSKLGIGSESERSEQVDRRGGIKPRSKDTPTLRVRVPEPVGEEARPASASSTPLATQAVQPVTPPPSAPLPPAAADPAVSFGGAGEGVETRYVPASDGAPVVGVLVGIEGPLRGEVFKIRDGDNKLGREGCELDLPHPTNRISRFHALIRHDDGGFVIEPNPEVVARNPTFLNEIELADGEPLRDGDFLRLADCSFKFRSI